MVSGGARRTNRAAVKAPSHGKASHHPVAPGGPNRGPSATYSGAGTTTLASLKLTRDAVLHWTTTGTSLSLTDPNHRLKLSGRGHRGQGFAAAGHYVQVRVVTSGKWTLQVTQLSAPS